MMDKLTKELVEALIPLLDSVNGDCYQGKSWEEKKVDELRALILLTHTSDTPTSGRVISEELYEDLKTMCRMGNLEFHERILDELYALRTTPQAHILPREDADFHGFNQHQATAPQAPVVASKIHDEAWEAGYAKAVFDSGRSMSDVLNGVKASVVQSTVLWDDIPDDNLIGVLTARWKCKSGFKNYAGPFIGAMSPAVQSPVVPSVEELEKFVVINSEGCLGFGGSVSIGLAEKLQAHLLTHGYQSPVGPTD
jgi:hypothetical protein